MKRRDLIEYALSVAVLLLLLAACQAVNRSHQAESAPRQAPIEETKPLHREIDTSLLPSQQPVISVGNAVVESPQLAAFIWNGMESVQIAPTRHDIVGSFPLTLPV